MEIDSANGVFAVVLENNGGIAIIQVDLNSGDFSISLK